MTDPIDLPSNIRAEQMIVGALMMKNELADRIGWLRPEYFSDSVHGLIFSESMRLIGTGIHATPVTLSPILTNYPDWHTVGGNSYMMELCAVSHASPVWLVDYAKEIVNAHLRRAVIAVGEDIIAGGFANPEAGSLISQAIGWLDDLGKVVNNNGLRGVKDYEADVLALYHGKRKPAFSPGFSALEPLYRIRAGELTVVTGEPSSGKSELVDAIAVNLAMSDDWKFALCSFENGPDEHIGKLCEKYLGQRFQDGPSARMTEADLRRAMVWVDEHFHFIRFDKEAPTVEAALAQARYAVDRFGINGTIFDPYNKFDNSRPNGMREDEYLARMLSSVTRFAANSQNHFWFTAHPAKPASDRRNIVPSLYDISGGANWANIADVGISIDRPFLPDGRRSSDIEVHVKKVRFKAAGQPGVVKLRYSPDTGRYGDIFGSRPVQKDWTMD